MESSFFYGYLLTQIPAGFLAAKFAPNKLFGLAIGLASFFNILLPYAFHSNNDTFIATIQILQGLVQGVSYPAMHGVWRYWAPPMERSKLATTAFTGSYAGAVIGLPVSAWLVSYVHWSAPFYVYAQQQCGNSSIVAVSEASRYHRSHTCTPHSFILSSHRSSQNVAGFGGEAIFMLVVAYTKSDATAVLALILAVGSSGFAISGFNVNHLDIAPRYAAILMGFSNGIGTLAGLTCPFVTEKLIARGPRGWQKVFLLASLIHFTGVTFYAVYASGELQDWAEPKDEEEPWFRNNECKSSELISFKL
ncbi:unnamed protein product [Onchocerca flexuosa]|uniref:MFS domain-containing protein n=1 Tax=Onchocerca flexuosa TaxID=387005 RepID=A0A183I3S9_9BILA|nr:unnamed protein product [Onchocerca flexuosa]